MASYQIADGEARGGWRTCLRAAPVKNGWLHYELRDGTNGLARPGKWRIKPADDISKGERIQTRRRSRVW